MVEELVEGYLLEVLPEDRPEVELEGDVLDDEELGEVLDEEELGEVLDDPEPVVLERVPDEPVVPEDPA